MRDVWRFADIRHLGRNLLSKLTLGCLVFASCSGVDVNSASICGGTVGTTTAVGRGNISWQRFRPSDEADDVVWSGIRLPLGDIEVVLSEGGITVDAGGQSSVKLTHFGVGFVVVL